MPKSHVASLSLRGVCLQVKDLLERAYRRRRAKDLVESNIAVLHDVAAVLLEKENIDGEEFQKSSLRARRGNTSRMMLQASQSPTRPRRTIAYRVQQRGSMHADGGGPYPPSPTSPMSCVDMRRSCKHSISLVASD